MKKILLILAILIIIPNIAWAALNSSMPQFANPFDTLQVAIPNMPRFTDITYDTQRNIAFVPWIAEYIKGIYNYGISIIGILAVIGIAVGGVLWVVSGGNPGKIGVAKSWIQDSLFGLSIALLSYALLAIVNKNLVIFSPLQISSIPREETQPTEAMLAEVQDMMDNQENDTNTEGNDKKNVPTSAYCPGSGGTGVVARVAQSFNGKIAYSMSKRSLQINGNADRYWYDCSYFASTVLKCAGLPSHGSGTGTMFAGNACNPITSFVCTNNDLIINGQAQKPGTIWGFDSSRVQANIPKEKKIGHVLIYIGNGETVECKGGAANKQDTGNCYASNMDSCVKYKTLANKMGISTFCYHPAN